MKQSLAALTGIRFLAAFYVFLFHVNMRIPFTFFHLRIQSIIKQGAIGVNIFFVLSGFILTYSHYQKRIGYVDFIKKRFFRIYPGYITGLLLCFFVSIPTLKVFTLDLFMIESYFPANALQWFGAAAWSVSTEFFFYLLFPSLLRLLLLASQKRLAVLLVCFVLLSSVMGALQLLYHFDLQLSYSFPFSRAGEFISGVIGGLLVFKYDWKVKEWAGIAGVAVLGCYFAAVGYKFGGWTVHNVLTIPVTLLLLAACVHPKKYLKWMGAPWMVYLGKISYGFYIVQIPLLLELDELISKDVLLPSMLYLIPLLFVLNLFLSIALYEVVEKPVHRFLSSGKNTSDNEPLLVASSK